MAAMKPVPLADVEINSNKERTWTANEAGSPSQEPLVGLIVVYNNDTMDEDLKRQLFSLPRKYQNLLKAIRPGLPLVLYNYSTRCLHGVFEASSDGALNIEPDSFGEIKHTRKNGRQPNSRFPAQVRMRWRAERPPLEEKKFRPVLYNYNGPKFQLQLSKTQAQDLLKLFEASPVRQMEEAQEDTDGEREERVKTKSKAGSKPSDTEEPVVSVTSSKYGKRPTFPWKKLKVLGAGTYGIVSLGVDRDGMFFATKEVYASGTNSYGLDAVAQLKQEVEFLKGFKHDNIVQYLGTDVGTDQERDTLYIFLELVEMGSLVSLYKKFQLEHKQIRKYTRDVLKGLQYLHERNIVHRDIKCANILVDKWGTCKLADFGVAKQISSSDPVKSTRGSVYWMAPEVVDPKKTSGLPADIWSLGCSVLEMATRASPFGEMEWPRAFYKLGRGEGPPLPDTLPDPLRDFVKRCLEVDPKDRPTATELLQHAFILQVP